MRKFVTTLLAGLLLAAPATAQQCGGSFAGFVNGLKAEAMQNGHSRSAVNAFFSGVTQDQATLRADRRQGVFQLPFIDFSRRLISQNRIDNGRANSSRWDSVFDRIESRYGVNRGVILAFWAFETDFGAVQGDFNTVNSLVTLAHDCRRPELFRPQVFAALELYELGDLDPATTTGAWAGEIGMVQMLPGDIIENGVDADGDGLITLKTSAPDALTSAASMLRALGWRPNEPWLQEVTLPSGFDWSRTGLDETRRVSEWRRLGVRARTGSLAAGNMQASVIVPQGRKGPAFLAYPNFNVYFEWNQSFVYVATAAYFATRLEGAPIYDAGNPGPSLSGQEIQELQRRLAARGHDVGGIDGILGANTRDAIRREQIRLGLPADAWPDRALLDRL